MNEEMENKKNRNQGDNNSINNIKTDREREREPNTAEQQQLRTQITQLDSLPTKTPQQQADLDSKKQKLKELEEKEKNLTKLLPLETQISILEREIRELEGKSSRNREEERVL